MTRDEWLKEATEWEHKAQDAYNKGNIEWGEVCEQKASACRSCADYAQEAS